MPHKHCVGGHGEGSDGTNEYTHAVFTVSASDACKFSVCDPGVQLLSWRIMIFFQSSEHYKCMEGYVSRIYRGKRKKTLSSNQLDVT